MAKMADDIGRTVYVDNPTSAFHGRSGVVREIDVATTRVEFGDRSVWFLGSELRYDKQTAPVKRSKMSIAISHVTDPEIPALITEIIETANWYEDGHGDASRKTSDLLRRAAKVLARMVIHVAD